MEQPHKNYQIKIDQFEGPFDLLLYEVRNAKININEVLISDITKQFIDFLKKSKELNIELTSSFIFTTSILLFLKSNTLIPGEITNGIEDTDDREEYIDNLIEYQKYKKAAQRFSRSIEVERILLRKDSQFLLEYYDRENWEEVSIIDLIITFSRLAKGIDNSIFTSIKREEISIDDKMDDIIEYLTGHQSLIFQTLFPQRASRYEFIITFLALLELVKMGKICLLQHKLFGNIKILKKQEF